MDEPADPAGHHRQSCSDGNPSSTGLIPDFMIQGGDLAGQPAAAASGYEFGDEIHPDPRVRPVPYLLAMKLATAGARHQRLAKFFGHDRADAAAERQAHHSARSIEGADAGWTGSGRVKTGSQGPAGRDDRDNVESVTGSEFAVTGCSLARSDPGCEHAQRCRGEP